MKCGNCGIESKLWNTDAGNIVTLIPPISPGTDWQWSFQMGTIMYASGHEKTAEAALIVMGKVEKYFMELKENPYGQ